VAQPVKRLEIPKPDGGMRKLGIPTVDRFKGRVRELTRRTRGVSTERIPQELSRYLVGWIGYFGKCETPSVLERLEKWFRRRLRSAIWKQRQRGSLRFAELRKRDVGKTSPHKHWAALMAPGGWRTRQLCISRCPMFTSTRLGSRD